MYLLLSGLLMSAMQMDDYDVYDDSMACINSQRHIDPAYGHIIFITS